MFSSGVSGDFSDVVELDGSFFPCWIGDLPAAEELFPALLPLGFLLVLLMI